jgi:hypothetical protein
MATGPEGTKGPVTRLPSDRATAPTPLEDSSDAAWQEFSNLQSQFDSLGDSGTPAPAPTARPAPAASRPAQEPVSTVGTMLLARSMNRVCPVTAKWAEMHALLPLRDGKAAPPPFGAADGNRISSIQKRLRLRDQIEWASATGSLPAVHRFLSALPEGAWEHFEEG